MGLLLYWCMYIYNTRTQTPHAHYPTHLCDALNSLTPLCCLPYVSDSPWWREAWSKNYDAITPKSFKSALHCGAGGQSTSKQVQISKHFSTFTSSTFKFPSVVISPRILSLKNYTIDFFEILFCRQPFTWHNNNNGNKKKKAYTNKRNLVILFIFLHRTWHSFTIVFFLFSTVRNPRINVYIV